MRNEDHTTSLSLGLGNPKPLGQPAQGLFTHPGRVVTISDFTAAHLRLLAEPEERDIVDFCAGRNTFSEIPDVARQCLSREPDSAAGDAPVITVRRNGGRSAYSPEHGIKWKGCRPVADGTSYPMEILPFGAREIRYASIPFGTLTPEAAMREILGYCFLREHDLATAAKPVCIYEYECGNESLGCCLVMAATGEQRIEACIEYPDCTIADVIAAKHNGSGAIKGMMLGTELRLRGVNLWRWAEWKSETLIQMNFNGGFRGVLNSNIGNDVLAGDGEFCLCDFDTFKVVDLPEQPDDAWLRAFLLWCTVETIKGSISILDYVELPERASLETVAHAIGTIYFAKSSLWKAYERRFRQEASRRGWPEEAVSQAMDDVKSLPAVGQALSSCILNSYYLKNMSKDRKVFYPHN